MNNFSYSVASSQQEAIHEATTDKGRKYIAGGTNLIDLWKYNLQKFEGLVDIGHLPGMNDIVENADGTVMLGALATNAETAYHPVVEGRYPLLSKAILAGASAQIRNMATNGGNLLQRTRCYYFYDGATPCNKREPGTGCSAINGYNRILAILGTSDQCIAVFPSDMCVALAALDATVHVNGTAGTREIPFTNFHRLPGQQPELDNNLQPGELITGISLPARGFQNNYSYLKIRDRNSYAFALVSVATGFELDSENMILEARLALGGVAHRPWRVRSAEEFLRNKPATAENFAEAARLILDGAIGYKHNSFKIGLAAKAIIRNCQMALDPANTQLPGAHPA
jgi:xanthine dehydrogenase YagS FAD-binding subunit